jgi:hypothetical protein
MNLIASTSATCVEGLGGMVPTNYAGERFDQNNEENFMQIEDSNSSTDGNYQMYQDIYYSKESINLTF